MFAVLRKGFSGSKELEHELKDHVRTHMGPIARPEEIAFLNCFQKPGAERL